MHRLIASLPDNVSEGDWTDLAAFRSISRSTMYEGNSLFGYLQNCTKVFP